MGPTQAQAVDPESKQRKDTPVHQGFIVYFPRAIRAVARLSKLGNDKHNPGEPLHWSRNKSTDHRDCIARHLLDVGTWDTTSYPEPVLHATELAWRAMANLEIELETLENATKPNPHHQA